MEAGILAGYPLIDLKATLFDGSFHEVDSSELAFKIAASKALSKARDAVATVLLEPIMSASVTIPEKYYGDVVGDLSRRRGQIKENQTRSDGASVVSAEVPLSEMFGYATDLRSMTAGRGIYQMKFSHYSRAPKHIADTIVKERSNRLKDED